MKRISVSFDIQERTQERLDIIRYGRPLEIIEEIEARWLVRSKNNSYVFLYRFPVLVNLYRLIYVAKKRNKKA